MTATETREVTYLGRRVGQGGKTAYAALVNGDEKWYLKRPFGLPAYASPGQVWSVTYEAGTDTFYVSGPNAPRFVRLVDDAEERAVWDSLDRATQATLDANKDARADGGGIADLCEPLARVYVRTPGPARAALLIRIITEVQRGSL